MCLGAWEEVKCGASGRDVVEKLVRCQCAGVRLGMVALGWADFDRQCLEEFVEGGKEGYGYLL